MAARGPGNRDTDRLTFAAEIAALGLWPLWEQRPVPSAPAARVWRWEELRRSLLKASELVATTEAERRVLTFSGPEGAPYVSGTLSAGLQIVMPGERATAHRHGASALRFVLESDGAFTSVNGERIAMHPGDLVITPAWSWHEHGNDGVSPAIWLDGLDAPITRALGASHPPAAAAARSTRRSVSRAEITCRLAACMLASPADDVRGWRVRYADPTPTLSAFMQYLPAGFEGRSAACEANAVMCVLAGRLEARTGDSTFECVPYDLLFVPAELPVALHAPAACVAFSFSDLALRERLRFTEKD